MKRRSCSFALVFLLIVMGTGTVCADFGHAGVMVSPAFLDLVPESGLVRRLTVFSGNYSWSFAPLFFKPDEREGTEACGAAPTDPAAEDSFGHLKLPGDIDFSLQWKNGWDPDAVSIRSWDRAVYADPENTDAYDLGTAEVVQDRTTLSPDRVYQITAEWIPSDPSEEFGQADYIFVTEAMTEAEIAEAEERAAAPFSEEDLHFLTVRIDGVDYILGRSTPQDMLDHGWYLSEENEEIFIIQDEQAYSDIYVTTAHHDLNEPMLSIDAMWAYESTVEYCGFDGVINDVSTDPDNLWLSKEDRWTAEKYAELEADDDFENRHLWSGMISWMASRSAMETSVEGIYTVIIPLGNGREVEVISHDSPVCVTLLPERRPAASGSEE